ncbi:hypothetical protein TrLO_g14788 [Triparma laevis f. longispina]|uniref:Methyltransferase small domain-containing protein n=1 Tax=Triparma laevis f. longispina TaxID=1714387 RepID=A0A9W7DX68_9STRA|nr:hypothetical protein TrLO_g14788 [Triparma laevis f. longispina]
MTSFTTPHLHLPDLCSPRPDLSSPDLRTIHNLFTSNYYTQTRCNQLLDSYVRPQLLTKNLGWDGSSFYNHSSKHVVEWNKTPFQILTALFLFGSEIDYNTILSVLGSENFELLLSWKFIKKTHTTLISPYSGAHQIYPLTVNSTTADTTALILTDWPFLNPDLPTQFAVMPVGYDSLELCVLSNLEKIGENRSVCDICCGSGIQGINYLLNNKNERIKVNFIDLNPRALSLCEFNVAFNNLNRDEHTFTVSNCWSSISQKKNDVILCNPPFVAVPETENEVKHYYADGGGDGNNSLKKIFSEVIERLNDDGVCLMVTELPNVLSSDKLVRRFLGDKEGKVDVAYVKEDVETIEEYSKVRNEEMGNLISVKEYVSGVNVSEDVGFIVDRALVLIKVGRKEGEDKLHKFESGQKEVKEYEFGADEPDAFLGEEGRRFLAEVMK